MGKRARASGPILLLLALAAGLVAACGGDDGSGGPDAATCTPVDDGNPCTDDVCTGGQPQHTPVTPGTACATGVCDADGACVAPSCTDGFPDGDETDVDCGGSCAPAHVCDDGDACQHGTDCASGVCGDLHCQAARCGDGVMQAGELCDDGNDTNGDGCDDGDGDACRPTGCGNGVVTAPELCDDGNAASGDGCDANCTPTGCGNGVLTGTEACDDGNGAAGDGCSTACTVEAGFHCAGMPSACTTTCGDGIVAGAEACDDAPPAEDGDGCSATCAVEPGFSCTGSPSSCAHTCGNGVVDAGEQCDDGNLAAGDGCGVTCQLDLGCGPGEQQRVASATPALAIPDGDPAGVTSAVTIAGNAAVTRAAVYIRGLTHPAVGQLDLALVSPGGVTRELISRRGGTGDDLRQTLFVDAATTIVADGLAPFTGRFRPEESLSTSAAVDDLATNAAGTWKLRVADLTVPTAGTLDAWSLILCVDPTAPFCGDGVRNGAEECDDGNGNDTDACSNRCRITDGCGDGNLDPGEACDDDNLTSGDGCSATCTVDVTCPAGQTPVVVSASPNLAIPDNDPAGIASTIDLTTAGAITHLAVTLGVTHTSDGDLDISLVGPGGTRRDLSSDNGGAGDDLAGTQLEDAATTLVTDGTAPFTGRFRPEQSLTTTAGVDFLHGRAAGAWTLHVADDAAGDTGTLARWTLAACIDPAAPYCGNGVIEAGEQCDDGNLVDDDVCSNLCHDNGCGNGVLDPGERCDDGNLVAGDGCSPACAPDLACGPGELSIIVDHPAAAAIPDNAAGLVSTVAFPTAGLVRKVIPIVSITHADDSQLDLFLESPRGVQHDLSSDQPGANYRGTVFTDAAATSITAGAAPYTGAFRPEQPISSAAGFADQQADGDWILRVSDDTAGVGGTLDRWSLAVCVDELPGSHRCGNGVVEEGETCDDGGTMAGDGCSATCQLELGCTAGQTPRIVSATDLPRVIPDGDPAGADSVLAVAGAGTVARAVVVATVTHTRDGDLALSLASPTGTAIDLSSGNGAAGDDYVSTIFADGAAASITTAAPPMRGRFAPEAMLSAVNGQAAAGMWHLHVVDGGAAETGVLVSWTLGLCVQ
ncbi:MAG TPA: DUF4215 domain-containing protein [Kofleriaceae bacterium]|nr:DUF4215 domain-containing protein [Kofleriaceae bacterium]